jgi:hypothetical protein
MPMLPVHRFMPQALASILQKAPLSPEKVGFAWRSAVGPALDGATSVELRGDVLHVRTKDAAWRREILRSLPLIRARLDALLGDDVVRTVSVEGGGADRR